MIPIYEPYLKGKELEYVTDAVKSGWVSSLGEYIPKFEKNFANYCNSDYGASTSNGTTALHLALKALGVKFGDEIIVPNLTFVATANAVTYCNATPVFVDCDESWCIDPKQIEKKITKNTKGIIAVHLYGMPADMDLIMKIAEKHGLFVLEDCAEAHGAKYRGKKVGSIGDASIFSFYGNKVITTGEGGMVLSDNEELIEKVKFLRDHGMSKKKKYWHEEIGYNYRMTNLQAAIGLAQLENIHKILEIKARIVKTYNEMFENNSLIETQKEIMEREKVCWLYTVLLKNEKLNRDNIMQHLRNHGIDSRPIFYPMNELPIYKQSGNFSVSESIAKRGISLPSSPNLKTSDIKLIVEKVNDALR